MIYNNSRELTITTTSNYPLSVWVYSFDFFNCSSNIVRYILQHSSLVALFATIHHLYCIVHKTVKIFYFVIIFVRKKCFQLMIMKFCCVLICTQAWYEWAEMHRIWWAAWTNTIWPLEMLSHLIAIQLQYTITDHSTAAGTQELMIQTILSLHACLLCWW